MTTPSLAWSRHPAQSLKQDAVLRADWDRLNTLQSNLPFMDSYAVIGALEAFGEGNEILCVAREGHKGHEAVAMFILVPAGRWRWRTYQPSQLPLGTWVAQPHIPLPVLARSLMRGPLGICLALSITQIDPQFVPRAADEADTRHGDYIDTGWIDIAGSFEDYWAARGKNLRQNMRKQRAKLESDGTRIGMHVLHEPAQMADAIVRYGVLESAGWKAERGTAVHADNDQGRFYRGLLQAAAERGEAAVYEYTFDDRVVAMNLCLERDGVLIVLKTAYDESIKTFSPAFLLRQDELEKLHREGTTRRLEYYGRLMEWHTRWTDNKRTLYHLTLYRWPLLKKLAASRQAPPPAAAAVQNASS